jgi:transglutaminase-like putative cysteine protease
LRVFYNRFTPSQGWATFALLIFLLLIVGDSVTVGNWVETPRLTSVLMFSALTGLLFAKLRLPWFLMLPAGVILGAAIVLWQSTALAENQDSFTDSLREIFTRLDVWYDAANSDDGISTDLMPFSLILISSSWILGFFSAWFIFRNNNIWFAVVFGGTAMLTNLSFLPEAFAARFFIFVLIAMLLVVRMSIIQRHETWRSISIRFTPTTGWLTLHATLWFSIIVIVLAAMLPLKIYVSKPVADIWRVGRTPVSSMEDVFVRLFATIPSRMDTSGRFFGKTLPFMGKISFGGEVVAWTNSEYPSYWLSQAYNYYTSQGWIASETERIDVGPEILPPPNLDSLKRVDVTQIVQLGFDTNRFLIGGGFDWVSQPSVAESLTPRKFTIDINDDAFDVEYPKDIQALSERMRTQVRMPQASVANGFITALLPNDLVLTDIQEDADGEVELITLQRKAPISPDLVAWQFKDELPETQPYSMVSLVSVATDEDLREADTGYSSFITDHYVQLPSTLPQRVRDLAESLTANADNPFDKAVAVQNYLRGPDFVYSQDIDAPPRDSDGVDHFLFDSKIGYSDYFGSSMAVLMRAAGVPARLAAGYAPGEAEPNTDQRYVRDSDSHGWTQVYFPNYGWIDFEPTPNWPFQTRAVSTPNPFVSSEFDADADPIDSLIRDEIDPFIELVPDDPGVEQGFANAFTFDVTPYLMPVGIALGVLVALFVIFQVAWNFGLGSMTALEKTYTKMGRLGWLAGVGRKPHQTPWEHAAAIGLVSPDAGDDARKIASQFAVSMYGHQEPDENALEELAEAWKNVRMGLIVRTFRRMVPQPNAQPQQAR